MAEMRLYDSRVTVERIEGRSVCGMKPGDYFELVESSKLRIPEGGHFCMYALQAAPRSVKKSEQGAPDRWLPRQLRAGP
jgi:uncharacterized repeat protein (TIGR04076 family)